MHLARAGGADNAGQGTGRRGLCRSLLGLVTPGAARAPSNDSRSSREKDRTKPRSACAGAAARFRICAFAASSIERSAVGSELDAIFSSSELASARRSASPVCSTGSSGIMSRGVLPGATVASGSPWDESLSMPAVASRHDRTPAPPRAPEKRQRRRKHCFTYIFGPAARTTPLDGRRSLLEGSASSTGRASSSSRCALGPFVPTPCRVSLSRGAKRGRGKIPHRGGLSDPRSSQAQASATWATRQWPGSGLGAAASVAVAGGGGELSARARWQSAPARARRPACVRLFSTSM